MSFLKLTNKQREDFMSELARQTVANAYERAGKMISEAPEDEGDEDDIFADDEEESGDEDVSDEEGEGDNIFGDDEEGDNEEQQPEDMEAEEEPDHSDKVEMRPTPLTLELGKVSSEGLIATLNMIRAGRSFKEPEVAEQLSNYFEEQLNDAERLALAAFLAGIRDITSGQTADSAADPGDENVNISAKEDGNIRQSGDEQVAQNNSGARTAPPVPSVRQKSSGLEDTSAPIRIGHRNESVESEYKNYVTELLHKSN